MTTGLKLLLGAGCVATASGIVYSLTRSSRADVQGVAQNAPIALPGGRTTGSHLARLPDVATAQADVAVEVTASLLPFLSSTDGAVYRAVWLNAICLNKGVSVGETRYHAMVPVGSTAAVNLSILGVELSPQDPSPGSLRSFPVEVRPRPGKAWGSVTSFPDDVVVVVSSGTH